MCRARNTLALSATDDASAACGGYSGGTAIVNAVGLHYGPDELTGSVSVKVMWPLASGRPAQTWSQCQVSGPSCQQMMVVCTDDTNVFTVYLSNDADRPGWAQVEANQGTQCYGNYTIQLVSEPD